MFTYNVAILHMYIRGVGAMVKGDPYVQKCGGQIYGFAPHTTFTSQNRIAETQHHHNEMLIFSI